MKLEDKELTFIVNGKKIIVKIKKSEFDTVWEKENKYDEIQTDRGFFDYVTAVGFAISKFEGFRVHAKHRSGNIAFEGYSKNGFTGNYTVYSDYTDMHSIDTYNYNMALKDIA
ncbi:MAG: hypothetical protein U9N59_14530 [Campylobacterota bacterium]|nr:hypothetical protein [Campylobacterota bacterium]